MTTFSRKFLIQEELTGARSEFFPIDEVQNINRATLDHSPLLTRMTNPDKRGLLHFCFNRYGLGMFFNFLANYSRHRKIQGYSVHAFGMKLSRLRGELKDWNREVFGTFNSTFSSKELYFFRLKLASSESDDKFRRESKLVLNALKEELKRQHQFELEKLKQASLQMSEDLKAAHFEIESHKSKAEGLKNDISGLRLELSDLKAKLPLQSINSFFTSTAVDDDLLNLCQEAYRLGFKDESSKEGVSKYSHAVIDE
ncbi:hypothetical protein ACH5RR_015624 [Cinchona calisaya]|uniref:Uncharacterized protein n=1 Tax=Cinchona calisaya TaxID=153742 RepID=A0ABD2ZWT5_9GENT